MSHKLRYNASTALYNNARTPWTVKAGGQVGPWLDK